MTAFQNKAPNSGIFLGIQFAISGILNAIFNGVAFWLMNREAHSVHYPETAIDAIITCVCVTVLVVFPTAYFTQRAIRSGQQKPWRSEWSSRLPKKVMSWWFLCLSLALIAVEVLLAFQFLLFAEWSFGAMLTIRCLGYGVLGGLCGLLTAWRFLLLLPSESGSDLLSS